MPARTSAAARAWSYGGVNADGSTRWTRMGRRTLPAIFCAIAMDLSYCVVNTNGRAHLERCLAAIARTDPPDLQSEVLVLENASADGSADYVRQHHPEAALIALERRTGKAENDSTLLKRANGR